ncbi:MAG: DegT/DnrJ/EryC1/StrS aminotransferase family protein [Spirochaetia bacterium]|nr:DegT/DnrJ/EryC1/StrS aminotransferase family protein [Spirochaetia bacterium]
MNNLPFALPDIGDDEINEVVETLKSGWITTGPKTKVFEEQFAEYIGSKNALAVNSATAGLHLALEAVGVQRGDKVITSSYTFTATAEVIRYFDADPVFCDIDKDTYNIDCEKLSKLCDKLCNEFPGKVKAIMPVHFAGQACDMNKIMLIAKKHNLYVIEDAAHALPATYDKKKIGTIGDITVFSFYATKTITTAEGGMITTDNADFARRMSVMRLHGFSRDAWDRYSSVKAPWYYEVIAPGYKYNMTDIAASLGIHQLKKCGLFYEKRLKIAQMYDQAFENEEKIIVPYKGKKDDIHSYHLYVIKVPQEMRDEFIIKMKEKGVGCSVHFIPLHIQPYYKDKYAYKEHDFPIAYENFLCSVSLPIYTKMTDSDTNRVIDAAKSVIS